MLLITVWLAGCSSLAPVEDRLGDPDRPDYHVVVRGENLFRIAWRYGLDYRTIARWNRLASPDRILAGQRLRLFPPGGSRVATAPTGRRAPTADRSALGRAARPAGGSQGAAATPAIASNTKTDGAWLWPAQGKVVKRFNPNEPGGKGIRIDGTDGQNVKAASAGQVVYKGSGLRGYGRLIIVKHSDSLLSAYGYLGQMFVEEGDSVKKGQVIAELDNAGNADSAGRSVLHFEIRENGRPIDPLRYLPG